MKRRLITTAFLVLSVLACATGPCYISSRSADTGIRFSPDSNQWLEPDLNRRKFNHPISGYRWLTSTNRLRGGMGVIKNLQREHKDILHGMSAREINDIAIKHGVIVNQTRG
jgi:hypothetical protein